MMRLPTAAALTLALSAALAGAAVAQTPESILQPQTQGSVAFVSGGLGSEGQQAIREAKPHYNLHLLFALQGSGEYLANIPVKIVDGKGATVLEATAEGPFMLVKLPPGGYRVTASFNGAAQTKPVTAPAKGAASQSFYWAGM